MAAPGPFPLIGGYEVATWLRARAVELGDAAVPSLELVALEGTAPPRATALLALAEIATARADTFVIDRARHDPSDEVREAATRALGFSDSLDSLAYLAATEQERAASIALHQRLTRRSSADLAAIVRTALDGGPSLHGGPDERFASLALEVLVARPEAPPELVLGVIRRRPALLTERCASRFSDAVTLDGAELLPALLEALPRDASLNDARARTFARLAFRAEPALVFEHLAKVVRAHGSPLASAVIETLSEQMNDAWTSRDGRGFDDAEGPITHVPDPRWREAIAAARARDLPDPRVDEDIIYDLLAAFDWTNERRSLPPLRAIQSGGPEGEAFVLAGFDVGPRADPGALARALAGLGTRDVSNLHHVEHQDSRLGGEHWLVGLPLATRALSAALSPGEGRAEALFELIGDRVVDRHALARVREQLVPFLPRLPELVGGVETLVWTAEGSVRESLEGLPVVRFLPRCRPWRAVSGYWATNGVAMRDFGAYGDEHQRLLEDVGARLGLGEPRIFVLWASVLF